MYTYEDIHAQNRGRGWIFFTFSFFPFLKHFFFFFYFFKLAARQVKGVRWV